MFMCIRIPLGFIILCRKPGSQQCPDDQEDGDADNRQDREPDVICSILLHLGLIGPITFFGAVCPIEQHGIATEPAVVMFGKT
jgi:hypothetical protein